MNNTVPSRESRKIILFVACMLLVGAILFFIPKTEYVSKNKSGQKSTDTSPVLSQTNQAFSFSKMLAAYGSNIETKDLVASQWFRVAKQYIIQKKLDVEPRIAIQIGLSLGDSDLFWAGITPDIKPDQFWQQHVHSTIPSEIQWRLLQGWPINNHTLQRWFLVLREWYLRPFSNSDTILANALDKIIPHWIKPPYFKITILEFCSQIRIIKYLPMLCFLDTSGRQAMAMAASFKNFGWSWLELSSLVRIPLTMKSVAAQWWIETGYPERALVLIDPTTNAHFVRVIEDVAIASEQLNSIKYFSKQKKWRNRSFASFKKWLEITSIAKNLEAVNVYLVNSFKQPNYWLTGLAIPPNLAFISQQSKVASDTKVFIKPTNLRKTNGGDS